MRTVLAVLLILSAACRAGYVREEALQEDTPAPLPLPDKMQELVVEETQPETEQEVESEEAEPAIEPEKKPGKLVRVQIYGDELIREEAEVDGVPVKRTTLRGNAVVLHNTVRIRAPLIVLEAGLRGVCTGGVRIEDDQNGLVVYAARADYDRGAETVVLSGLPGMVSSGRNRKPAHLTSTRMVRDMANNVSTLDGDVRIYTDGWTILGQAARFEDREKRIDMADWPIVFGRGQYLTGAVLHYFTEARQLTLEGGTLNLRSGEEAVESAGPPPSLEQYVRRGEAEGGLEGSGPSALSSDSIVHDFSDRERPKTTVKGNVLFTRDNLRISAPSLESIGRSGEYLVASEGVESVDRRQNLRIVAGRMVYERSAKNLRLEKEPRIDFLEKDSEETTGSLSGALIERNFETKETIAQGGVRLLQSGVTAVGQRAVYREDTGALLMEGEPGIEQAQGKIRCEKIVYYPEKRRLILLNRIRGELAGSK